MFKVSDLLNVVLSYPHSTISVQKQIKITVIAVLLSLLMMMMMMMMITIIISIVTIIIIIITIISSSSSSSSIVMINVFIPVIKHSWQTIQ